MSLKASSRSVAKAVLGWGRPALSRATLVAHLSPQASMTSGRFTTGMPKAVR